MSNRTLFQKISSLSVNERVLLVQRIWDSLPDGCTEFDELSPEQQAELHRRIDAFERDPKAGRPWADVREALMNRVRPTSAAR
ncbi:MAG: addiction module protein [Phycisphaerae bacterium]